MCCSSVQVMEVPTSQLLLHLLLWGSALTPDSAYPDALTLVNVDIKHTVDLSCHLAKVMVEVVLEHSGGSSTFHATSLLLVLELELEAWLAHFLVQVKGKDEEENNLEV